MKQHSSQSSSSTATIFIRASEQERTLLEEAAKLNQVSVSEFILKSCCEQAEETITASSLHKLREDAWDALSRRLDEPIREQITNE